jgi:hypothetical protein
MIIEITIIKNIYFTDNVPTDIVGSGGEAWRERGGCW